ncbi:MAG: hypothetical protein R3C16_05645 [Hyphomonadaceae bacterium]
MTSSTDRAEYRYDPQRFALTFWLAIGVGVSFLFVGALSNVFWFGALMAAVCGALALWTALHALRRKPVLTISSEGLRYAPFSEAVVPWADIAAVSLVRRERLVAQWGKGAVLHQQQLDTINFVLRDGASYPRSLWRTIARQASAIDGRPAVSVQLYFLKDATAAAVIEAISRHWPGTVEEKTIRFQP